MIFMQKDNGLVPVKFNGITEKLPESFINELKELGFTIKKTEEGYQI